MLDDDERPGDALVRTTCHRPPAPAARPGLALALAALVLVPLVGAALVADGLAASGPAFSGPAFSGVVRDQAGRPLSNVVVTLEAAGRTPSAPQTRKMDQRNEVFLPHVLPVTSGDSVLFANSDKTKHQVYSFMPAQRFAFDLPPGSPGQEVRFDTPGVFALGCNIHDHMLAFVVVGDSDLVAVTDRDGRFRLAAEAGDYRLALWHPRARDRVAGPAVTVAAKDVEVDLTLTVNLRRGDGGDFDPEGPLPVDPVP